MLIPFILEKAMDLYADREAVVCGEKRFTYREFYGRVNGLAHFLYSQGLRKGGCVAICHQNSHEFLETYFAVARIGAILNPLNFRLSPKELASILEDSGAGFLIAADRFGHTVEEVAGLRTVLQKVLWTGRGETPPVLDSYA
jgi:acyl-CoA synthetase (AMP-forming)/AMP-acid ligase II